MFSKGSQQPQGSTKAKFVKSVKASEQKEQAERLSRNKTYQS